jgi:hypothetical protein
MCSDLSNLVVFLACFRAGLHVCAWLCFILFYVLYFLCFFLFFYFFSCFFFIFIFFYFTADDLVDTPQGAKHDNGQA